MGAEGEADANGDEEEQGVNGDKGEQGANGDKGDQGTAGAEGQLGGKGTEKPSEEPAAGDDKEVLRKPSGRNLQVPLLSLYNDVYGRKSMSMRYTSNACNIHSI